MTTTTRAPGTDLTEVQDAATRDAALKLWVVLARANTAIHRHILHSVERHGLTEGEFGVLEVLLHKGPLLLGEVARKILASSGGVTYLVDRLEKRGLVERRPCPTDRRAMYAVLTPNGQSLIEAIFPEHAAAVERAVSGLDDVDRAVATKLLKILGLHAESLPQDPSTTEE